MPVNQQVKKLPFPSRRIKRRFLSLSKNNRCIDLLLILIIITKARDLQMRIHSQANSLEINLWNYIKGEKKIENNLGRI